MDELEMQLELGGDHLIDASGTWNNLSCANTSTEVRCAARVLMHGAPLFSVCVCVLCVCVCVCVCPCTRRRREFCDLAVSRCWAECREI